MIFSINIELLKGLEIEGFDCARKGMAGKLCYLDERGAYVLLACGHPLIVAADGLEEYLGITLEQCPVCGCWSKVIGHKHCLNRRCRTRISAAQLAVNQLLRKRRRRKSRNEEERMSNQQKTEHEVAAVPEVASVASVAAVAAVAAVTANGFEDHVDQLRIKKAFLKLLESEVGELEGELRRGAMRVCDDAVEKGGVRPRTVRFIGTDGMAISVAIPNEELPNNRKQITDEVRRSALTRGIDIDQLGVLEHVSSARLTGDWVDVVRALQDRYIAHGKDVPPGLKITDAAKVSVGGLAKLRELRDNAVSGKERDAYEMIISAALRSAAVLVE